jgi:hypothetical protein
MEALTFYNQARQALAQAARVDEVKAIRDQAEALRVYTKQAGEGLEMQNWCAEIKLRAERRAGELLREMEKHPGGNPNLSHDTTGYPPTLEDLGISRDQSSRWQTIASLPEEIFETHIEETKAQGEELTSAGVYREAVVHQSLVDHVPILNPLPDAPVVRPMERWLALVKELWVVIGSVEKAGGPAAMSEAWTDAGRQELVGKLEELARYLQEAAGKIRDAMGVIDVVETGESR